MGVIYLEDPLPGRFEDGDLILLTLFANQVATGIEKVDLNERLHRESMLRSNLERFLSPRVVELVTRDCIDKGDILLKSERINATVLFSDIQGFTLLSEKLDPQEIADLLTDYFTLMTEAIFTGEGTLDKFMGDGLVAIFGAPFPYPDHPSPGRPGWAGNAGVTKAVRGQTAGKQEICHPDRDQYRGNSGRIYGISQKNGVYNH